MGKVALLFPGQGAQHVGMGRTIAARFPAARALYDQASEILGYDLAERCFEGPATQLDSTAISQPAIFVTSLAALEMLRAENPQAAESCQITAGLSLGEYTALGLCRRAELCRRPARCPAPRPGDAAGRRRDPLRNGQCSASGPRESRVDPRSGRGSGRPGDRQLSVPGEPRSLGRKGGLRQGGGAGRCRKEAGACRWPSRGPFTPN